MPSTKRPLSSATANRAECAYTARTRLLTQAESSRLSVRKRGPKGRDKEYEAGWYSQASPFRPNGSFQTEETVDVKYAVDPAADWRAMTRYHSLVLGGDKFHTNAYVYVAHEESLKRRRTADATARSHRLTDDWVARILEIRALDSRNVFVRVFWMYWPDELPAGTVDGGKSVKGRQSYHGEDELIASNHMDVIRAVSVTGPAKVHQWSEANDEDTQPSLYWRQFLNVRSLQLSSAKPVCRCKTPAHPDKTLICCPNRECGEWMHDDCLRHEALMRIWERLGTTNPQAFYKNERTIEGGDEAVSATPTSAPAPTASPAPATAQKPKNKRRKKEPYRGFFKATLDLGSNPFTWQVEDLRDNISGGAKTWHERAWCLFCSGLLD